MGIFKLNGIDYMGGGGGGNANEQVLTWAEYCALTEEEKNNGTTYYIDDINGEGKDQFQPVIYSEEEREIGVWTDGKPLYEKTLVITSPAPSGATGTIDISSLSVEVCLIADGYFQLNDGLSQIAINEDGRSWCHYYNDHIHYEVQYTTTKMVVRIRYTKTTDQPGSGTWTPQGVPAVHYDDTEKVVGTWFGETLYEKTIQLSSTLAMETINTWIDSGIDISYVDKLISFEVIADDGISIPALWCRKGNNHLGLLTSRGNTFANLYITLRYTKSTI